MTRGVKASLDRGNLGFLLAKASQRWNEMLYAAFCEAGHREVRPAFGSILIPLYEEDGLRMGELAERARLSKQTMTTMVRLVEKAGLVVRKPDPEDARAARVYLTAKAKRFREIAERVLANLDVAASQSGTREENRAVRAWLQRFIELVE